MQNPPQNLLDKAIAIIAPRTALRRMQSRMALALAGGYNGASYNRPGLAGDAQLDQVARMEQRGDAFRYFC